VWEGVYDVHVYDYEMLIPNDAKSLVICYISYMLLLHVSYI
jgi:hypothetical protein